ncbi:MAG: patatin-like phospholipase family protein [Bacteroidetes bacterium]|nr:patatin-like phospholipase family protein [Bacteroidota bacterium]
MTKYRIGITMAGAVSAGAYTAGVLTELMETLDAWYKAKQQGLDYTCEDGTVLNFAPNEIPAHEVEIQAFSGSSAGGMCAALFAFCLGRGNLDALYQSWVKDIDLRPMLDPTDIPGDGSSLYSLLNTAQIDKIANAAADFEYNQSMKWPAYLSENIDLYLTLTNLEGIPYGMNYNNLPGSLNQGVMSHADYTRFRLVKPGYAGNIEPDALKLDPSEKTRGTAQENWNQLRDNAPATGAFPIGLKARMLRRTKKQYEEREWYFPFLFKNGQPEAYKIKPGWAVGTPDTFDLEFSDGGVLNNEPFELVRRRLAINVNKWRNETEADKADGSVIMVDPFPTEPPKVTGTTFDNIPPIQSLVGPLFGAMRNQSMFDQELFQAALNKDIYSRYLISPVRKDAHNNYEKTPLASSSLMAFGGFIHEDLREHDFKLGRYNCQRFLRNHYSLPLNNPMVSYATNPALLERYKKAGWVIEKDGQLFMSIVPSSGMISPREQPVWPQIARTHTDELRQLAYKRFVRIREHYVKGFTSNKILSSALNLGLSVKFGEKWFTRQWEKTVEKPLLEAGLMR